MLSRAPAGRGSETFELTDAPFQPFSKVAKVAFPGAHFVGTPRENVTPLASEFRAVFETPDKGYCFVWHETFGLKGRTAFSPGLFAMFNAETSEALSRE